MNCFTTLASDNRHQAGNVSTGSVAVDRGSGPQGDKYSSHLQADTIKPHHLHIKTIKEYIFFDVSSILPMTWLYRIYSLLGFVFSSFSTFNIGLDPSESVRWMNAGSLSLFQWIKLLIKLLPRDPGPGTVTCLQPVNRYLQT